MFHVIFVHVPATDAAPELLSYHPQAWGGPSGSRYRTAGKAGEYMEVSAISQWPACAALMCVGCLASFHAKHESEASGPEGIAHRSLIDLLASVALRETVMDHRKSASTSETGCVVANIEIYKQTPQARGSGARRGKY